METPNHIYVQQGAVSRTEKTYDNDIKYICEDVILEWIEGMQKKNNTFSDVELVVTLKDLKDKIKEL